MAAAVHPTVGDIVKRLFPLGSNGRHTWDECPWWPPDLFAVAATLVRVSGCYALRRLTRRARSQCEKQGNEWRNSGQGPSQLAVKCWQQLLRSRNAPVGDHDAWWDAALKLLALSDQASAVMGFWEKDEEAFTPLASFLYEQERAKLRGKRTWLPWLPNSICWQVPREECAILPKARVAPVGCTVRSLSHHLALLPPFGEVQAQWLSLFSPDVQEDSSLNLLLVPFPYEIDGHAFEVGRGSSRSGHYFRIRQTWLDASRHQLPRFLRTLVAEAKKQVGRVDCLVLPELALDKKLAKQVKAAMRREGVALMVTGLATDGDKPNCAHMWWLGESSIDWSQSKGNRWKLNSEQISRYSLGHVLNPAFKWWEDIPVLGPRELVFAACFPGACLAVLLCEDLARNDPLLPVVQAVGPNLLIALLLDGPQREHRWPGRYATSLADDPGSAVLTLTALGMIRRWAWAATGDPWSVSLWKEPNGRAVELVLPPGAHAMLLTLSPRREEEFTLDGRSDGGVSVCYGRSGVRPIAHPAPAPLWATTRP